MKNNVHKINGYIYVTSEEDLKKQLTVRSIN